MITERRCAPKTKQKGMIFKHLRSEFGTVVQSGIESGLYTKLSLLVLFCGQRSSFHAYSIFPFSTKRQPLI